MFRFGKKKGLRNLSKKTSKKKKYFLALFLPLILISLLVFGFQSLKVKKINIAAENLKCLEGVDLENEIGVLGKSIFFINEKQIESKLKNKYSCVESLEIKKKLPVTIMAKLNSKKAVLVVSLNKKSIFRDINSVEATASTMEAVLKVDPNSDTSKNFLVDQNGDVFAEGLGSDDTPKVEIVKDKLEIGDRVNKLFVQNALIIFDKLKTLSISITRAIIDGDVLFVEGKPQLLFSLDKDSLRQSASLQLILQKAKMDSKEMDKIDLRFDKVVVVYSPKKYGER